MKDYNLTDFTSYFNQFAEQLEQHRKKSLLIFIVCSSSAAALVFFLPWYAQSLAETLDHLTETVANSEGGQWKEHASATDAVSIALLVIAVSVFLVLWPILSYHGSNKSAGMVPRDYSFKDYVYSHLLKYFGDFDFAPEGGMLASDIRGATILPPYQGYVSEDYIKGVLNESTVKLAETEMAQVRNKEKIAVFKGLLVVIDISETRIKLRRNFAGKTVLIFDPQKELPQIAKKYASYQHFDLDDAGFESEFEAYTTDPDDAQKLLSKPFIETLLALQKLLSGTKEQYEHFDDKIAYAARAILDYVKMPSHKLPSEKSYEDQYGVKLDITKEDAISLDPQYINRHVQAEFYDDKVVITIPCKNDLFEPNSLFEPPINQEDCMVLFTLMQGIDHITKQLNAYFEAEPTP